MTSLIQPSFAKGEVGPDIHGRVDTAAYQIALRRAVNVVILASGGAAKRPGTYFIGPCKQHEYAPRLLPFEYKTTDAHVLEFGEEYIRVVRNNVLVTETGKTITGISQANPGVVTAVAHGFVAGNDVYISGVVGMTAVNGRWFKVGTVLSADTFQLKNQVTAANFSTASLAAYVSGGTVERVYEIASPYQKEDLFELTFTQTADVMTITHKNYAPRELRRSALTSWALSTVDTSPSVAAPEGVTVSVGTSGAIVDRYKMTAINATTGEESLSGLNDTVRTITAISSANPGVVTAVAHGFLDYDEVEPRAIVGMTQLNNRRFIVRNKATDTFDLYDIDGNKVDTTAYTAYVSGGTVSQTFVRVTNSTSTRNNTIASDPLDGAAKYSFYREKEGIFGLIGESLSPSFLDANVNPDIQDSPPSARTPFQEEGSFPGAVGFYEQRRVFGGSNDNPDRSEYSQAGRYSNFSRSSPLRDDDAISANLPATKVEELRHYLNLNDLIAFTRGGEWRVNSGPDSFFASGTIKQKRQTAWGSAWQRPLLIGNTGLFVQENGNRVRSIGYTLQSDGYTGTDLNLLSSHLFRKYPIVDWDMSKYPDNIIHAVRADGAICALTFQQEQEVIAWTRWFTSGKFEAVACLRRATGELFERTYFVVKRVVNGNTVRYIERLLPKPDIAVEDRYYVDCGLSLDLPITITGVTSADPCIVTAPAHGLTNGDVVDVADIEWVPDEDSVFGTSQPDQLNGHRFIVASATTDTFKLTDLNGDDVDASDFSAYVEGGVVRKAVDTVGNLWHLEGRTLVALCDGNVAKNLVVTNGQISLDRKFSRIHAGLRYVADVETLDKESPQGTIQGKTKAVGNLALRMQETNGLYYGPSFDADKLVPMRDREFEQYDEPTQLSSDIRTIPTIGDWNTNGRICVRSPDPLPMTILGVVPDYVLEDYDRRGD